MSIVALCSQASSRCCGSFAQGEREVTSRPGVQRNALEATSKRVFRADELQVADAATDLAILGVVGRLPERRGHLLFIPNQCSDPTSGLVT
jgi:hypothetical protein